MLTPFPTDHAFGIAWFGLMAMVWFGWAQEDPPPPWRWRLGVGSVLGLAFTGVFLSRYIALRNEPSALEGQYHWFGVLVGTEVVVAVIGALFLWRTGRTRWQCWWVAMVVAVHFVPMMVLLDDLAYLFLATVQTAGLLFLFPILSRREQPTSRLVGPFMGVTLLLFAAVSTALYLTR